MEKSRAESVIIMKFKKMYMINLLLTFSIIFANKIFSNIYIIIISLLLSVYLILFFYFVYFCIAFYYLKG